MKRTALALTLIMPLLLSAVAAVFLVNFVKANGFILPVLEIYIRSDGSIEPSTVPIRRAGDVYVFTEDVLDSSIEVQRDNIVIDGAGFILQGNDHNGIYLKDRSNVTIKNVDIKAYTGIRSTSSSNIIVIGNRIQGIVGLDFSVYSSNNQSVGNTLMGPGASGGLGIWIWGSYNSIINNSISNFHDNIIIYEGSNNKVSGNFWSDYHGTDANDDGIGGTPYIVNSNNKDNYPLMAPVDNLVPSIKVLSPDNKTYDTSSIPLNFTVNEAVSQITYSLDGEENITITGNTTLTGLANGDHNLTIHAKDEAGNVGTSETMYFSVDVPFPTGIVVASIASMAVISASLLVYFKKRRH